MKKQNIPRFGRVRVPASPDLPDEGTAIWFDSWYGTHVVELDGRYRCWKEEELEYLGDVAPEAAFLGRTHEISFDTHGPGGGPCVEGCLRRPGTFWECLFVRAVEWEEGSPRLPRIATAVWRSGIKGHLVEAPKGFACVHADVTRLVAELLEVSAFNSVLGPDSIWLK